VDQVRAEWEERIEMDSAIPEKKVKGGGVRAAASHAYGKPKSAAAH
jgi:hypothetical protein